MKIDLDVLEMAARDRGITVEALIETVERAMLSSYYKMPGAVKGAKAQLDLEQNTVTIMAPELDEEGHATGEYFDDTPTNFTQAAISTVRSVISESLRSASDQKLLGGFKPQVGELVNGVVETSPNGRGVWLRLTDDLSAVLPVQERVPGEELTTGMPLRAILLEASHGPRGLQLVVSRCHPDLVLKLFAMHCPEINDGDVEITSIAREAGHRTKIAVRSRTRGVKAKPACIGEMGMRVRAVMSELKGEKIDIVDWHENPAEYVASALSPAKVSAVSIVDEKQKQAKVLVTPQQLSLAIGKDGQNARLAARLTGWKIDIRSTEEDEAAE